jgi:hypothetical protein
MGLLIHLVIEGTSAPHAGQTTKNALVSASA